MTTTELTPGAKVFADRGGSARGMRATRGDTKTEVATLTEVIGDGVAEVLVVEFDDGTHETFRAIDGYVRPIPQGWTPERDQWGRFNYHRTKPYPDAAATEE